jgi:hypothetical protein
MANRKRLVLDFDLFPISNRPNSNKMDMQMSLVCSSMEWGRLDWSGISRDR